MNLLWARTEVEAMGAGAAAGTATAGAGYRLTGVDFTKGLLVLVMVLYHWLNYFYGIQGDYYRYLRFLTPSYIFMTGFLVSYWYLPRLRSGDAGVPKRVLARAVRLFALFLGLNFAIEVVFSRPASGKMAALSLSVHDWLALYAAGNTVVQGQGKILAFTILMPISYLLLLSAGLLLAAKSWRYAFEVAFMVVALASVILNAKGTQSVNLDLMLIGLLGALVGKIPIGKIDAAVSRWTLVLLPYACVLMLVSYFPVGYELQSLSTVVTVALIYRIGRACSQGSGRALSLLGRYSLFAYLMQIAILQVLHRAAAHMGSGSGIRLLWLIATAVLTLGCVVVLDKARARDARLDHLYRAVFA